MTDLTYIYSQKLEFGSRTEINNKLVGSNFPNWGGLSIVRYVQWEGRRESSSNNTHTQKSSKQTFITRMHVCTGLATDEELSIGDCDPCFTDHLSSLQFHIYIFLVRTRFVPVSSLK